MSTDKQVLEFITHHHKTTGQPASLSEIAASVPSLNYRSSALKAMRRLLEQGQVVVLGRAGTARRYVPIQREPSWP